MRCLPVAIAFFLAIESLDLCTVTFSITQNFDIDICHLGCCEQCGGGSRGRGGGFGG